ncbi:MAG: Rrf2 family transcriptional regulator [Candidatus Magasanikbacteria bacterium]|nr:Rrf2 family transcriptional regulator [Candidatus Magasanikbacteria bacterium]
MALTLNRQTDYALQFLAALARLPEGESLSLAVFAKQGRVSFLFLQRIAKKLRTAGLITAEKGRLGGYKLARVSQAITVLDVAEALEGKMAVVPCIKKTSDCPHAAVCQTRTSFHTINSYIQKYLHSIPLSELGKKTVS